MTLHHTNPLQAPPRLAALHETGLFGSPPEPPFDRLTQLASDLLHAPVSLLTLVSDTHQFFVSSAGLAEPWASRRETPLSHSFCKHVVSSGAALVIEDAGRSRVVRGNPAIEELGVGAYAGFPLHLAGGLVLGDLCVFDHLPRAWLPEEIALLESLSAVAEREIEQRVALRRSTSAAEEARADLEEVLAATLPFRTLAESSLVGIAILTEQGFSYVNPRFAEIFGYSQEEIRSFETPAALAVEADRAGVSESLRRRLRGEGDDLRYSFRGERKDGRVVDVEVRAARTTLAGQPVVVGTFLDVTERRRHEEALRRGREHFRSLIENAWNVVHTLDTDGIIRYVSPGMERVLGLAPEAMVGRHATEFVHPEDLKRAQHTLERALADPGTPQFMELRLRHADGSTRTVETSGCVTHDDAGRPMAVVHTHDVTKQKRIECALRETEERYRMVVRATNSAVWDWDIPSGRILWNGHSHDLLRFHPGEMDSSVAWWYEHLHPDERQPVLAGLHSVLEGVGESWSHEHRFLRGDGSYATVLNCCSVLRDEHERAVRVIGSMTDVTERKRQEEAKNFLARASMLLDDSLDAEVTLVRLARLAVPALGDCCLVDVAAGEDRLVRVAIAHVDPVQERLLRARGDASPEAEWQQSAAEVVRTRKSILIPRTSGSAEHPRDHGEEHADGVVEPHFRSVLVVPLVAHDRVLGAITLAATESQRRYGPIDLLVAEDLAHRAALAIEHAQLFEEATEALGARDEMLGIISHDLRNPLNAIQLTASLMLDEGEERRAENVEKLKLIQRASHRMNRMVQDLLDVSSMEAGRLSLDTIEQDVALLTAEAEALLRPIAEQKSVYLQCSVEDDLAPVHIDAHRMLRVLSNLVGNAIKFTPEGGTVSLRAEREGDEVRFTVSDTGPGIPPELLSRVFDRYWQARRNDRRGTGLGLAIARGIVEAHGGRIWAESRPRSGAVFVFTVPVVHSEKANP